MSEQEKKKFLILQMRPEDETSDGEFNAFLEVGGLEEGEVERIRLDQQVPETVELSKYSAMIAGGSPYDLAKPENEKSENQLAVEKFFDRLLTEVIDNDFPFLGACSGNGLLGKQLGAPISGKFAEPVSGMDVTLTEAGKKDKLLEGLPETFRVLAGHKEACDETPRGAVLLASSKDCPVHMFRVGKHVYATQFHPESDGEVFRVRILIYKNHGYFPPEDAEVLIDSVKDEETPHAKTILRRFVDFYRK